MSLPSFLQRLRQGSPSASVADAMPLSSADIEVARVRARRRLVGMVVLVGAGVIGLPWLFETQPRPLSSDVQVVSAIPSRGGLPASASGRVSSIASVTVPAAPPEADKEDKEVDKDDGKPVAKASAAPAGATPKPRATPATPPANKPSAARTAAASAASTKPPREAAQAAPPKPVAASAPAANKEAVRAKALLEGKPPVASAALAKPANEADTRYVVQIGAYADGPAAQEVRLKAERAGAKTYTQVVTTPAGKRIRVRLGPYATKAEVDKAMDTLRKAGLSGAVLTL